MKREMSVAGSFYPDDRLEIQKYFEHFNNIYDKNHNHKNIKTKAVIVPHAGYIYSGYSANIAYRILQDSEIKTLVVIGPSHRVAFNGVSLCNFQSYKTPFGDIEAADTLVKKLQDKFQLNCFKEAHAEHSTEVQFPFIKYYMPKVKIIELVYSQIEPKKISILIDFILSQKDCGVIISTDLSHFYNQKEARELDTLCLESIKNLDISMLHSGCEACGIIGVEAIMLSAKRLFLNPKLLDYRTSGDASGDNSRVVGYMSAYF